MIISLINKKRISSQLFLVVFISFLSLSFSHSHSFNYKTNNPAEISEINNDQYVDPLLDSNFNCIICSFYNSITTLNVYEVAERDLVLSSSITIEFIENFNSVQSHNSNNLRAPPQVLV